MYSWEVICIELDAESEYNDCRAITEIGYKAPSLNKRTADSIGAYIDQNHKRFHIEVDGREIPLKAVKTSGVEFYVRTLDEDSASDPLLDIQDCTKYEQNERLQSL